MTYWLLSQRNERIYLYFSARNLCIVARLTPRSLAASNLLPSVFFNASSSVLESSFPFRCRRRSGRLLVGDMLIGRYCGSITLPRHLTRANCRTFCNSRTLPGHWCSIRISKTSGDRDIFSFWYSLADHSRKFSAKRGISLILSRNGGMVIGTTQSR